MRRVISGVPQSYGCQNMLNQHSDAPASKAAIAVVFLRASLARPSRFLALSGLPSARRRRP